MLQQARENAPLVTNKLIRNLFSRSRNIEILMLVAIKSLFKKKRQLPFEKA